MKEELILKVKPETLDSLMNALVDITSEMKAAAPDQQVRFGDEVYMTCLCLYGIGRYSTGRTEEKRGQRDCRITGSPERRAGAAGTAGKLVNRKKESVESRRGSIPLAPRYKPLKFRFMAKNFNQGRRAERQFKQKLRTMISSAAHTQNIADQAMDLAGQFMTEDAISNSDAYRVIENVSCACEEAMQVLIEELKKGTRLYEILPDDSDDIKRKAIEEL